MKKIAVIFLFIGLFLQAGNAQINADEHITGHVTNKTTKAFIPFINIALKGTTITTIADATGHYFLKNIPKGRFTLVASGVGYKSVERAVDLTVATSLDIHVEMEEDLLLLESVVVSSNRNNTNRKEAPSIVHILDIKTLENTNAVCLAQGLNFQPGLRTETNCQNCGLPQVRMNGLDGTYSQILIDSRPIYSALQSVYGLEQIPVNMIERVEVVRGGGSAIFGTNAIGGTVNIITKAPTSNSLTLSNSSTFTGMRTLDLNTSLNASVVSDNKRVGVGIFGSSRQRDPFDANGDGFSEITQLRVQTIGFKGYFKTSNYSKLTLEYHNLYNYLRGGNAFDLPVQQADIAEEAEYFTHTGGLNYDAYSVNNKHHFNLFASTQLIDRKNYAGAQQDLNGFGKTTGKTFVTGTQYTYSMQRFLFMPADLTTGAEYNLDKLDDEIVGYHRSINQNMAVGSAFLQNEWKNKKTSLLLGFRLDKHTLIKEVIFSPRLNIRYNPIDWMGVRAGFSTGFRAPQVYDEDLHGSAIGGAISFVQNSPNLKPETSQSYTASIDLDKVFGKVQTELLLEGFYTNLNQVFVLNEVGTNLDGSMQLERSNTDGAVVRGFNIEGKMNPFQKLQLQLGVTFQKSTYNVAQQWSDDASLIPQRKMFRSPNSYGFFTANYEAFENFLCALSGTYTGSMLVQHFAGFVANDVQQNTPKFYDLNVKLSYDLKVGEGFSLQLNGGVQNVFNSYQSNFDQGTFRDSKYIYGPALPRSLVIGMKVMI